MANDDVQIVLVYYGLLWAFMNKNLSYRRKDIMEHNNK